MGGECVVFKHCQANWLHYPTVNKALQVALLFLAKDVIPTEPIWTAFIAAAAELRLRTVPPLSPHTPSDLLPQVPLIAKELAAVCWKHSKQAFFAGGSGRSPFLGALLRISCLVDSTR